MARLDITGLAMDVCFYCHEPLTDEIDCRRNIVAHIECSLRVVLGSVGHLRGRCFCVGGTEEDPEGMSLRDGARMAVIEGIKLGNLPYIGVLEKTLRGRLRPSTYPSLPQAERAVIDAALQGAL